MRVFGCDFSGAKDAANKICVCEAKLQANRLFVRSVKALEERLDLLHMMLAQRGIWGVDMPFSLPHHEVARFGGWRKTIALANEHDRQHFKRLFPVKHSKPSDIALFRATDRAVNAKSPISSTPLDMLSMTYGAFKLLDTLLLDDQVAVYPLALANGREADLHLFEVYPRCLVNLLGRSVEVETLTQLPTRFSEVIDAGFSLVFADELAQQIKSEHAFDALLACITIAYCVWQDEMHASPEEQPRFLQNDEWAQRVTEGAIVRISL